jgi:hypothetical protein
MDIEDAIVAALEQGGIDAADIRAHPVLGRYPVHEIETAVSLLEADQRIFVLRETDAQERPFTFSRLMPAS